MVTAAADAAVTVSPDISTPNTAPLATPESHTSGRRFPCRAPRVLRRTRRDVFVCDACGFDGEYVNTGSLCTKV